MIRRDHRPLARRYREQPVLAVWEGSGNVIALDVLRALARDPDSARAFEAEIAAQRGTNPDFDAHTERTLALLADAARDPMSAEAGARRLVESMALSFQASVLLRDADPAVAQAFCTARLGAGRGFEYGAMVTDGIDLDTVIGRA